MFNKSVETVATVQADAAPPELVPLSHLSLDLPRPPEGWAAFLGRRAIAFVPDDLGRDCVRRQDARRLLDEQRADDLRQRKRAAVQQREEEEADKLRRALIWKGVAATALPAGVGAGDAMLQAARDSRPKRTTPLEEAFDNQVTVFHSFGQTDEAS